MSADISTEQRLITAEEFMEMDFDHPVELVRGGIVHMAPPRQPHGGVAFNIGFALGTWALPRRLGRPTTNDSAVRTESDPDTVRGADVCFFLRAKLDRGAMTDEGEEIPPDLCVEVLSPSNTWGEVKEKIDEYLACGVTEVWIAEPDLGSVEIRRIDEPPRTVRQGETLTTDLLPGFEAEVSEFFDLT